MVEIFGEVKNGEVFVKSLNTKLREVAYTFKDGEIKFTVEKLGKEKTSEQMRYFWNEVAVKLFVGLCDLGWRFSSKEAAVEFMKPRMGFVDSVYNPAGELEAEIPKSMATSKKHEIAKFTEELIQFIVSELNIEIQTPEEWKKLRGWKSR